MTEWKVRTNESQYKMFSWNGHAIRSAEDRESGVMPEGHTHGNEWADWDEEGLLVDAKPHANVAKLALARAFFTVCGSDKRPWRFSEPRNTRGVLDAYTATELSFVEVEKRLKSELPLPLFWGLIKALRDTQLVMKSPAYSFSEAKEHRAPVGLKEAFQLLPAQSAERLSASNSPNLNLFQHVNLNVVADFLLAKRSFSNWCAYRRRVKAERVVTRRALSAWLAYRRRVKALNATLKRKLAETEFGEL